LRAGPIFLYVVFFFFFFLVLFFVFRLLCRRIHVYVILFIPVSCGACIRGFI
jgi:hypothetical protein